MINWGCTNQEYKLIIKILIRAIELIPHENLDNLCMILETTHLNGNPIDFKRLLLSKADDFCHDIIGITNHINRRTGALKRCFTPRHSLITGDFTNE